MSEAIAQEQPQKLGILLVNNSPIVLRGLCEIIGTEQDMAVVGQVNESGNILKSVGAYRPDVVIMDISTKGGGGVETIRHIRNHHPHTIVLVLSMHDESFYAEYVLRAGANGYVTMLESPDQLLTAIRRAHATGMYVSEKVAEGIVSRFVENGRPGPKGSLMRFFSEREFEVFEFLGQGLTVRQIAEKLHRSVKTVEAHRENIKKKLRLSSTAELLRNAIHWVEYRREV